MHEIPIDRECEDCGSLTWRKELGAADRHYSNGIVCQECGKKRDIKRMYDMDAFQRLMALPRIYAKEIDKYEQKR